MYMSRADIGAVPAHHRPSDGEALDDCGIKREVAAPAECARAHTFENEPQLDSRVAEQEVWT
jgi:hypothetical protein